MKIVFTKSASIEFLEAIEYYNNQRSGLGYELSIEIDAGLEKILKYIDAWQELAPGIRRYLVNRFPFGIIYSIEKGTLLVLSIMNLHKNPRKWDE